MLSDHEHSLKSNEGVGILSELLSHGPMPLSEAKNIPKSDGESGVKPILPNGLTSWKPTGHDYCLKRSEPLDEVNQ